MIGVFKIKRSKSKRAEDIRTQFKAIARKRDTGALNSAIEFRNVIKLFEVDLIMQSEGPHMCIRILG